MPTINLAGAIGLALHIDYGATVFPPPENPVLGNARKRQNDLLDCAGDVKKNLDNYGVGRVGSFELLRFSGVSPFLFFWFPMRCR